MSFVRVQHIYNAKSGLAEDGIVNVFHFIGPPLATPDLLNLAEHIVNFYDVAPSGGGAIDGFIHTAAMAANRHTIKVYDMNALPPAPPVYEYTPVAPLPANDTDSTGLPHEVALCLSYRTTPTAGQIPARHRGRIFLGPLKEAISDEDATLHQVRPAAVQRDVILDAAVALKAAAQTDGWSWVGFSPTEAGPDRPIIGEAGVFFINQFLIDDAFDTQRRRGEARTIVEIRAAG